MHCLGQCLIVRGHCFTRHALPRVAPALLAHAWEGGSFPTRGREEEAESGLLGIISGCLLICVINFAECQQARKKTEINKKRTSWHFVTPICHRVHRPLSCHAGKSNITLSWPAPGSIRWALWDAPCHRDLPLPFCRCLMRKA